MTKKDFALLKSWGDLHPERPHLPQVGKRVCLPCLAKEVPGLRWLTFGPHKAKLNCHYTSPSRPWIEYPTMRTASCNYPAGGTYRPFPKTSMGDQFYTVLQHLGYTKDSAGDYS